MNLQDNINNPNILDSFPKPDIFLTQMNTND